VRVERIWSWGKKKGREAMKSGRLMAKRIARGI
jgi:hypothetical protein